MMGSGQSNEGSHNQLIRDCSRGSNQDRKPSGRTISSKQETLESVSNFFHKYSGGNPSKPVTIPRDEFNNLHEVIKKSLQPGKKLCKGETIQDVNQSARMEKKEMVHLLNTSNTTSAAHFVDKLEQNLKKSAIGTIVLKSSSDVSNLEHVYVIVCNKIDNETTKQAVDRSLSDIEGIYYKRIILIVLHVTRIPPRTSTRDELISEDAIGKYGELGIIVDMAFQWKDGIYNCKTNENALSEIKHFCSKYYATKPGEISATAETSIQPPCASPSDINFADQPIGDCEEVKEEFPIPVAYIIDPSRSTASKKFVSEFQQNMRNHNIKISETPVSDVNKLDLDAVLILVCNNASRIDTDIGTSLNAISENRYSKTILIILHVKSNDHNRRSLQRITSRTSSEMYTKVLGMIDMSFTIDEGIYECTMNTNAFKELKEIYDTHAPYGAAKTEQKEIEAKHDIPEDFREKPSDQTSASNNAVPTKRTKTRDELEQTEDRIEERPLLSPESEISYCYYF
ncbi:uncharacterized protein LOC128550886 isoform X2 [Mercenaria mercenaria]|uniref:uncharacterized protein LOC128550886 isoform X2 n=1 Tax=Mercenaria mercenaria TaxID=6596 RepID=UPI00234EBC4F|nr:uncharacterized protein LOC128550886 isoform X2 [Mercenaria mercenaria]XP_053386824.1 uncharacterized protein LOC128550886 isoform X2 [Mercenaria mercenaria]